MTRKNGNGKAPEALPEIKKQMTKDGAGANGLQPAPDSGPSTRITVRVTEPDPDLEYLESQVRSNPENAANWFDLGKFLLDSGQNRRAEAILRQAVRRAPESASHRYYYGIARGNNGKFRKATEQFITLAQIDPELNDPMSTMGISVLTDLGYCLGEMGRWKEAVAALVPALTKAISILDDLAGFLAQSGDYQLACHLYSVALQLNPGSASLLHGAGHAHMKAGRLRIALNYCRRQSRPIPMILTSGTTLASPWPK